MKLNMLCSGSKGNCFVLEDQDAKVMIDCGSTKKYLNEAFKQINLKTAELDALLITHEHQDHIRQIKQFSTIECYAPSAVTANYHQLQPLKCFWIKHLKITVLPLSHDANATVGYIIENKLEKLVYITDTGYVNQQYYSLMNNATYIVLESNHDLEMLMQTKRPHFLKARIYGDCGHLCNQDCANILQHIIGQESKEVFLAHISEEANTNQLALETTKNILADKVNALASKITIVACQQYEVIEGGLDYEKNLSSTYCCTLGLE